MFFVIFYCFICLFFVFYNYNDSFRPAYCIYKVTSNQARPNCLGPNAEVEFITTFQEQAGRHASLIKTENRPNWKQRSCSCTLSPHACWFSPHKIFLSALGQYCVKLITKTLTCQKWTQSVEFFMADLEPLY